MTSIIEADVAGVVWKILVAPGDSVVEGDVVAVLESMKMEIPIEAQESGTVTALGVREGDTISVGDVIVTLS